MPFETATAVVEPKSDAQPQAQPTPQAEPTPTSVKVGGKEYASWDEVGKAYEHLQSEYGRTAQKYGDLERQYQDTAQRATLADQWNQWWQRVGPLWGDDVEALLREKLSGGRKDGQPQHAQPAFEGFETLSPQEQYAKLAQAVESRLVDQFTNQYNDRLSQLAQAVQQTLAQKEQQYQSYITNYLTLMRRAFDQKLRDPQFDIDGVMEHAAKAIGGQIDPIELGQQLIAASEAQSRIETARKDAYEQAKRDLEQAQKNKQMETVPPVGQAPIFKFSPNHGVDSKKGLGSMRQSAAENLFKKFGSDLFSG